MDSRRGIGPDVISFVASLYHIFNLPLSSGTFNLSLSSGIAIIHPTFSKLFELIVDYSTTFKKKTANFY